MPTGWFRVEIATVAVTSEEMRELRERDVVLVDALVPRPEKGELVLSNGSRFDVSLSLEDDWWIATVGVRLVRTPPWDFAVNLAHRIVDARELPAPGARIALLTTVEDPLCLSWGDEVFAHGNFAEVEGQSGVRITSRRRV
jgi:hypothetical protein